MATVLKEYQIKRPVGGGDVATSNRRVFAMRNKNMNFEDFRKANEEIKRYVHFDNRVSLKDDGVWKYITDPNQIQTHAFYPFITFEKNCMKYSHINNELKDKKRPISYSAHIDRCIYQYYAYLINEKYNIRAESDGINKCAVAYRNNLHKNNVDFAHSVFEFIMKNDDCYIIVGDFKSFFDSLDHSYLKERLCDLLGCTQLSKDYYAVFKSITKYSNCMLEDILAYFRLKNRRKTLQKLNTKERIMTIEEFHEFKSRRFTKNGEWHYAVQKNKIKGIPQGSAISAVLANVYMLAFDYNMNNYINKLKGLYMRYSDDFIVVIPGHDDDEFMHQKHIVDRMINEIPNLILEGNKTQIFSFSQGVLTNVSRQFAVGGEGLNTTLDYLGFSFDGIKVKIRDKTTTKYYYRMHRKVNTVGRWLYKHKRLETSSLYKLYSDSKSKKEKKPQNTDKKCKRKKFEGNFISYTKRARKIMGEDAWGDKCELRHLTKLRRRLTKVTKSK